jgi:7-cyano-7-deazaguanine synthase
MKVAALVSGGLDSCVMLRDLASRGVTVLPVYVRTGLLWEDAETYSLERFLTAASIEGCDRLTVLELPVEDLYGEHWSVTGRDVPGFDTTLDSNYLPGRNLLLLSKAVVFCALRGVERLAMAPLADNPFPDGTREFFCAFANAASVAFSQPFSIELPFREMVKGDVIRRGVGLPLELTFSCIRPCGYDHCGDCTKCAERQQGFRDANLVDPTCYRKPAAERDVGASS